MKDAHTRPGSKMVTLPVLPPPRTLKLMVREVRSRGVVARIGVLVAILVTGCAGVLGVEDITVTEGGVGASGEVGASGGSGGVGATPPGGLVITPSADVGLDLGTVRCGAVAEPREIVVANPTASPVHFAATLPAGQGASFVPSPLDRIEGDVPPGGTTKLPVVAIANDTGDLATVVSVSVLGETTGIPVRVKATGAKLVVTPGVVAFGKIRFQEASTTQVEVTNSGTEAAQIDITEPSTDFVIAPRAFVVAPGGKQNVTVTVPATTGPSAPKTWKAALNVPGLCGVAPELGLTVERITTDVAVTGTVDFGPVPCGATPAAKPIVITNYGAMAASFTATAPAGYVLTTAASGTVPPAVGATPGTTSVGIRPTPFTSPSARSAMARIALSGVVGAGPRDVRVSAYGLGAVLQLSTTAMQFQVRADRQESKLFYVTNSGSADVTAQFSITNTNGTAFDFAPGSVKTVGVVRGTTAQVLVRFQPQNQGNKKGVVNNGIVGGGPLCGAGLPAVSLDGNGT